MEESVFVLEQNYTLKSLDNFLNGTGGDRDWDDFTSISLNTPIFNEIRKGAVMIDLPLSAEGEAILKSLF